MIKKLVALAATALFSLNANAGYVQYDLSGPVSGFFVQHDDDKTIALYELYVNDTNVNARFAPSMSFDNITGASTYFLSAGPTNFDIFDNLTDYYVYTLSLDFSRNSSGFFSYSAHYTQYPIGDLPDEAEAFPLEQTYDGFARVGTVPEWIAASLDAQEGYADGLERIVPRYIGPTEVPEPSSFALLALGAAGLARTLRRKALK